MDRRAVELQATDDGIATIAFRRPDAANALDLATARDLRDAALEARGARVIVLAATGRFFCAGGDLPSFVRDGAIDPEAVRETAATLHEAVLALADGDAPVIAKVQGIAAGAGVSLVAGADLVIAAREASFVFAYGKVGLSCDGGASHFLPRVMGPRRALEFALSDAPLDAAAALAAGLVNRVVDAAELDAVVAAEAGRLAARSSTANAAMKALLRRSDGASLAATLAVEEEVLAAAAASADAREGVAAFLERRAPVFDG